MTASADTGQSQHYGLHDECTANYGVSDRNQREQLTFSLTSGSGLRYSLDEQLAARYNKCFLVVFIQYLYWKCFTVLDAFYKKRPNKACRVPRISRSMSFRQRKSLRFPDLRSESIHKSKPKTSKDVSMMAASQYESNVRLASESMLKILASVPGALMGHISHQQTLEAFQKFDISSAQQNVSRPLPKGSLGLGLNKPLHDDSNGIVSHGVWRTLQEDPANPVWFQFFTHKKAWEIKATQDRMCFFNGHIPHRTVTKGGPVKPTSTRRVHHSAYIKPEHEHISLVLCSPDCLNHVQLEN